MRRLRLVLAAFALLIPGAAGATKPAHLVVAKGSAEVVDGTLSGWFVVANRGGARSASAQVSVTVTGGVGDLKVRARWHAGRMGIPGLAPRHAHRVRLAIPISERLRMTDGSIEACAEGCRRIGRYGKPQRGPAPGTLPSPSGSAGPPAPPSPSLAPTGSSAAPPAPPGGPPTPPSGDAPPLPVSTVPTDPIAYEAGTPFEVTSGPVPYWAFVPDSYDPSNLTPAPLLVWLHGCGGESSGDTWTVDPGRRRSTKQR